MVDGFIANVDNTYLWVWMAIHNEEVNSMNTADLCPEGRELIAKYEKCAHTYQTYKRIHMIAAASAAYLAYRQHVDECAICKQEEE